MPLKVHAVHLPSSFPASSLPIELLLDPYFELLSSDPKARDEILQFRLADDSKRALISRLLPRYVISSIADIDSSELRFERNEFGKPFAVHHNLPSEFTYSVSHDSAWVICATSFGFGDSNVKSTGIDLMRLRIPWHDVSLKEFIEIVQPQLSKNELEHISSVSDPHKKLKSLLSYWCLKESYIKALGLGMKGFPDLGRLDFDFSSLERMNSNGMIKGYLDGAELKEWNFELRMVDEHHLMALAVQFEDSGGSGAKVEWEIKNVSLENIVQQLKS